MMIKNRMALISLWQTKGGAANRGTKKRSQPILRGTAVVEKSKSAVLTDSAIALEMSYLKEVKNNFCLQLQYIGVNLILA